MGSDLNVLIEFSLYSRPYCHLCDVLEAELLAFLNQEGGGRTFALEIIDVDTDPGLEDRFGERVPVLVAGDMELCHFHFDAQAVRAYLNKIHYNSAP